MAEKTDDSFSIMSERPSRDTDIEIESLLGVTSNSNSNSRSWDRNRRFPWLIVHAGIILLYTLLFLWSTHYHAAAPTCQPMLYSPANAVIQRVTKLIDENNHNIYMGEPNEESDAAWHELLSNINLRITPQELRMLNQTSVELVDGGYLGTLGVYHELHCVKRLRKYLYKDYYYPNSTTTEEASLKFHASHCLEQLRQAAMCHGDTTMTSFEFRSNDSRAVVRSESLHQCVAWEPLRDWASARRVDLWRIEPESRHIFG